jgi:8-oxo-dGTP pyrophosphatase MutT (NUDIX family)
MSEMIDVFTEQGEKIKTMSKKEYYSLKGDDIPWINCCTCFVIDGKNKKILFEKRGKRFLDPGKLDLCSGHVQSGEAPFQGMIRELSEELAIPEDDARNLHHLGNIKVDYTNLQDETNRKNLKCFVSVYALRMQDISKILKDSKEVIGIGWLNFEDTVGFIENSMTRMPYEENLKPQYDKVFENLKDYVYLTKRKKEVKTI